jgi:hypothetical protein
MGGSNRSTLSAQIEVHYALRQFLKTGGDCQL